MNNNINELYMNHANGNGSTLDTLKHMNSTFAQKLIYNTILQLFFLLFGILGNAIIIYIYKTKLRKKREERFFITILAVTDLIHCIFSSSFTLTKNLMPLLFPGTFLCKFLLYFTNVFYILSLLILVVICIQRYQKICRPLRRQMTSTTKRIAVLAMCFLAALLASPKMIYWGERGIALSDDLKGIVCGPDMSMPLATIIIPFSGHLVIALTLGVILTMSVLYGFVGRVIFKQMKQFKSMHEQSKRLRKQLAESVRSKQSVKDHTSGRSSVSGITAEHTGESISDVNTKSEDSAKGAKRKYNESIKDKFANSTLLKNKRSKSVAQLVTSNMKANRSTIMFMVITLVTIVAYIPTWVYVIFDSSDPKRWFTVSNAELQGFVFMRSLNAISYLANPYIYAYYDRTFRAEFKKLILGSRAVNRSNIGSYS